MLPALNEMKTCTAPGTSEVSLELIAARGGGGGGGRNSSDG